MRKCFTNKYLHLNTFCFSFGIVLLQFFHILACEGVILTESYGMYYKWSEYLEDEFRFYLLVFGLTNANVQSMMGFIKQSPFQFPGPSQRAVGQHHRPYQKPQCPVCLKYFFNNQTLRRHMDLHRGNRKLYTCSICFKSYTYITGLYQHRRTHLCTMKDVWFMGHKWWLV